MKVALVQCPVFSVRMPLLGQGYLRSCLEKNDIEVEQFDFNIDLYQKSAPGYKKYWNYEFEPLWIRNKFDSTWDDYEAISEILFLPDEVFTQWAEGILRSGADLIGFTVYSTSVNVSILLAKKIKQIDKNKKIIFGGPLFPQFLKLSGDAIVDMELPIHNILNIVDMIAIGEGEDTLLEVAKRIKNNQSLDKCQGIILKEGGQITANKLRPLINDLDLLLFPDFSVVLRSYNYTDEDCLPIMANRGCPNRCTFCDYPHLDRYKLRFRKIGNVVEEIKYQTGKYGTRLFHFNDSMINANPRYLSDLCDLIIAEGLKIRWGASASISPYLTGNLFEKMKRSGCEYLSFGIESASPNVLQDMGKNFTIEDIKQNIIVCYKAGISLVTNWIVGFPTETLDDFQRTLQFLEENKNYFSVVDVASCTLKPHTEIYDKADRYGIKLNNGYDWSTKDGLNTYEERLRRLKLFVKIGAAKVEQDRIGGHHKTSAVSILKEEIRREQEVNMISEFEQAAVIKQGPLRFYFDHGRGRIFYNEEELTKNFGLYTSVFSYGAWIDSLGAVWTLEKISNKLITFGDYRFLYFKQKWEIEIINPSLIKLNITMIVNKPIELSYQDINIMLPEIYRDWEAGNRRGRLSKEFTKDWQEAVRFGNEEFPVLYSKGYSYKEYFPSVRIKPQSFALNKHHYMAIHNTNEQFKARLIVCRNDFSVKELKLEPGEYTYFSGYIEIKKIDKLSVRNFLRYGIRMLAPSASGKQKK